MSAAPLLHVEDLAISYPGRRHERVTVVHGVSFQIPPGTTVGLVGESGSGKTTVARSLVGLTRADSGHAWLGETDLLTLRAADWPPVRRRLQLVLQDPLASLNPRLPVAQALTEPLRHHFPTLNRAKREARIRRILDRVDLSPTLLDRLPHTLSGGQRQRVNLARALLVEPELLLCDEPVSALDVSVQARILNLLQDLQEDLNLTLLIIAHDLAVVEHLCDEVLVMQKGVLVEAGTAEAIYRSPQHPYTRELLASVPSFQRQPDA